MRKARKSRKLKPIVQEHSMGCGLACVAYVLGKSYATIFNQIDHPERAWTRGFYCAELVAMLRINGRNFRWRSVKGKKLPVDHNIPDGSIIFVAACDAYPMGHFLVKIANHQYMNPWINFPTIKSPKAGFVKYPGKLSYVIEPLSD